MRQAALGAYRRIKPLRESQTTRRERSRVRTDNAAAGRLGGDPPRMCSIDSGDAPVALFSDAAAFVTDIAADYPPLAGVAIKHAA